MNNNNNNIRNDGFDCVVYHSPCPDGTCACWIVQKFHRDSFGKEIDLFPCRAGSPPEKELEYFTDKNIIFVDICPDVEYLLKLSGVAKFIHIIDHHKTNFEKIVNMNPIPDNITHQFDMNQSGCQLTWNSFYDTEQPWFVQYIGDRDIWKFSLPNTNEYFSGIIEENLMNLDGFQELFNKIDDDDFKFNIFSVGKKSVEFREKCIQNVMKFNKLECKYKNYRIWLYNCTKDLTSDVGNKLLKYKFSDDTLPDFSVGWIYDVQAAKFWISMRSDYDRQDVSSICAELGGGGHRNASGCTLDYSVRLCDIFVPVSRQNNT